MPSIKKQPKSTPDIIVAGDIVLDRHIYEGERAQLQDQTSHATHFVEEPGGAALTHRLIVAVLEKSSRETPINDSATVGKKSRARSSKSQSPISCHFACKLPSRGSSWPERLTGYACFSPLPKPDSKDKVWRVSRSLGYGQYDESSPRTAAAKKTKAVLVRANDLPNAPEIVLLDDAHDDFRRKENEALWCLSKSGSARSSELPKWIVLKLAGRIGQGDLWDRLMRCQPRQRLAIIVSARLLRRTDVRLSAGLSWERSVEHLMRALWEHPDLKPLQRARHLIVNFEHDAAVWIDFKQKSASLVYDAENAEGEWGNRITGKAFGYLTCLTAAVAQGLASGQSQNIDLQSAIERGLSAMRKLREDGHGVAITEKGKAQLGRGFPVDALAMEILHPTHRFVRAAIPWERTANVGGNSPWTILASLQNPNSAKHPPLYGFARQLVIRGESALAHVPHLRIGKLLTAGRDEMESLRALRRIFNAYRDYNSGKKPLSVGVFGSPGSGKSFGVEQLALGIFGEPGAKSYEGWMEFNLSQFDEPKDLIGAFHQVRDRVLQGLTPVVFWDEFDSNNYKWLQYLLAPMQDGHFQEGQITHTLGKCVFIFAGGTAWSYEEFGPSDDAPEEMKQKFRLAKGPDFKSRLDGYLNVLGPNQRTLCVKNIKNTESRQIDKTDIFFPVRRALMIRNILGCKKNEGLEIDDGLLTALLEISTYEHGSRSLQKVLEPFVVARKKSRDRLQRSQLPAPNQLSVHVNSDDFHKLCLRNMPFNSEEIIDKLAPAIHYAWADIARKEGRDVTPYEELPRIEKRSNEAAALRIPDILALVGLQVTSGSATPAQEKQVREHIERHLEALAEEEHNRWSEHNLAEGWRFAEIRNDAKRLHNCLKPYLELPDLDKEKDRNTVRHFPDYARIAGFKIVFIGDR